MSVIARIGAFFVMLGTFLYILTEHPTTWPPMVMQGAFLTFTLIALADLLVGVFEPEYDDDDAVERWAKRRARKVRRN